MDFQNFLIAVAYFLIPIEIARIARAVPALASYRAAAFAGTGFLLFILVCGIGHLLEALHLPLEYTWHNVTAAVSVPVAVALLVIHPHSVKLLRGWLLRDAVWQKAPFGLGVFQPLHNQQDLSIIDINPKAHEIAPQLVRGGRLGQLMPGHYDPDESGLSLMEKYYQAYNSGPDGAEFLIYYPYSETKGLYYRNQTWAVGDYLVMIYADITHEEELKQEREVAIAELKRSNADLEQFAYASSHDLRSPALTISNLLEILLSIYADNLSEEAKELIDASLSAAKRMADLIDSMLIHSRIGRAEDYVYTQDINLSNAVQNAAQDVVAEIRSNGGTITLECPPDLTVHVNKTEFARLLMNLLQNAAKYRDRSRQLEVLVRFLPQGEWVEGCVADNGRGISNQAIDHIFELFRQGSADDEGLGIGLSTCRKIVQRYGGQIWAESELGTGTRFYFTLPRGNNGGGI